jgi:predicted metalloprotease
MIRVSGVAAAVSALCAGLLIAGCSSVTEGRAVSPLYDPFRAGGLPAEDGPSGVRDDAPEPTGDVQDTDGGAIDRLTLLAVNDVADFWEQNYSASLDGSFEPIERLVSYDSQDPSSPAVCGTETYDEPNAFYCPSRQIMAWDPSVMVPTGRSSSATSRSPP